MELPIRQRPGLLLHLLFGALAVESCCALRSPRTSGCAAKRAGGDLRLSAERRGANFTLGEALWEVVGRRGIPPTCRHDLPSIDGTYVGSLPMLAQIGQCDPGFNRRGARQSPLVRMLPLKVPSREATGYCAGESVAWRP